MFLIPFASVQVCLAYGSYRDNESWNELFSREGLNVK
jgi:hypothetical protein